MDVRPEDGKLEQPSLPADRRVCGARRIRRDGAEHRDPQIDRQQHRDTRDGDRQGELVAIQRKRCPAGVHREGDEGGEREARDGHEPLGHPRRVEPRPVTPEGLVARQVGTEGEEAGEERGQPEQEGEATAAPDRDQPRDRHERRQPPEEHQLLDPAPHTARDEVRDLRRVPVDLGERAAGADRARDGPAVDGQARDERDGRAHRRLPPIGLRRTRPRVSEHERDRPEREVELAGERDRREADSSRHEPAPLEREQRRGEEE